MHTERQRSNGFVPTAWNMSATYEPGRSPADHDAAPGRTGRRAPATGRVIPDDNAVQFDVPHITGRSWENELAGGSICL